MQGKHYYDFTLHFKEIVYKGPFVDQQYQIPNLTLVLAEGTDQPNARNIKKYLNDALTLKYEVSMVYFLRGFTVVTAGASIMAWVANASVSREIHAPSETWLNCVAHALNNVTKSVLASYCNSKILEVVVRDLRSMKRIVEDVNRIGWNHLLPNSCRLMQESETRFSTHYQVAERFLKAPYHMSELVETHLSGSAEKAYSSLKKASNIDGTITGYPGIEAIFDGFGIVVYCIERFETSQRPTMHVALPSMYRMIQKLENVSQGKEVWRGEGQAVAHLSIYSRELCGVIRMRMLEYWWNHPLLLVGCYLNPLFREIEFMTGNVKRTEFHSKADAKAQKASLTSYFGWRLY